MENKPASLLVVPLGKALGGFPPSWCGSKGGNPNLYLNLKNPVLKEIFEIQTESQPNF